MNLFGSGLLGFHFKTLFGDVCEQSSGEVTFTEGWDNDCDHFSFVFGSFGQLNGSVNGSTCRYTDHHTFFLSESASHGNRFSTMNSANLVNYFTVENFCDNSGSNSLNLVRSLCSARKNWAFCRLDSYSFKCRLY
jgi:hypothetical protein